MLLTGTGWFIYTFFSALRTDAPVSAMNTVAKSVVSEQAWNGITITILPVASVAYLIILVFPIWQFIRNYRFVQVIRTTGLTKIDAGWRMFVRKISADMGIKRKVQVWMSDLVQSPVTIGYLKPVILIPVAAINNLNTQQVEAILLHELSHIRRFDYLLNLVINMIRTGFYFNPFVRCFVRSIEREREISCDEMVMQFQYQPHDYASALLILQRAPLPHYQMMMAATGNNNLLKRVEAILGIHKKDKYSVRRLVGAICILVCMVSMNAFLFINNNKETREFTGFAQAHNPYYFMSDEAPALEPAKFEISVAKKAVPVLKKLAIVEKPIIKEFTELDMEEVVHPPYFYNVSNFTEVAPQLAEVDEAKVQGALQATRKILEENQWKEVEKSYAELLNSKEKSLLKDQYLTVLDKFDWEKLGDKLRLSYDQIDWNKIEEQVGSSLAVIRLDSIKTVMTQTLHDLNKLECWMKANNTTAIPDTDITLLSINENQKRARAQIDRVKAIKSKKIIRL